MGRKAANPDNFIGNKYGNLTVKEFRGMSADHRMIFLCKCDCGNEKELSLKVLKTGNTKSCGCLKKIALTKANEARDLHGLKGHRIYSIWHGMKSRCYNPNTENYKYYGGRGITVCDEWRDDVVSFYNWAMANGYQDDLTIDRKDNYQGYSPSNCRWATIAEQNKNKR